MTAAMNWELDQEHEEFRASVRAFVDDLICRFAHNLDRPRSPLSWKFGHIVIEHHEVQAADELRIYLRMRVFVQPQDVGHRRSIASKGFFRLLF